MRWNIKRTFDKTKSKTLMTCLEIQLKNRLQLLEVEDSTNESEEVKRKSEMMEEHYTKAAD